MNALHRGRLFLTLLEQKKHSLEKRMNYINRGLTIVNGKIKYATKECEAINEKLVDITPSGLQSREMIYNMIRAQSLLLSQQQEIMQHIFSLKEEKEKLDTDLQQCCCEKKALDKRLSKITSWVSKLKNKTNIHVDFQMENENQEVATYGR